VRSLIKDFLKNKSLSQGKKIWQRVHKGQNHHIGGSRLFESGKDRTRQLGKTQPSGGREQCIMGRGYEQCGNVLFGGFCGKTENLFRLPVEGLRKGGWEENLTKENSPKGTGSSGSRKNVPQKKRLKEGHLDLRKRQLNTGSGAMEGADAHEKYAAAVHLQEKELRR